MVGRLIKRTMKTRGSGLWSDHKHLVRAVRQYFCCIRWELTGFLTHHIIQRPVMIISSLQTFVRLLHFQHSICHRDFTPQFELSIHFWVRVCCVFQISSLVFLIYSRRFVHEKEKEFGESSQPLFSLCFFSFLRIWKKIIFKIFYI